jgi:outer membrane lipoprotein SlyB
MKSVISILIIFVLAGCSNFKNSRETVSGPVEKEEAAIAIAVNEWNIIYGPKTIASEKPYSARLEGDVWIVTGSLPKGYVGGVAMAIISKKDGSILKVSHGK